MREYKKRYDEWMRNPYFDKETKEELFNLRFQQATGNLEKPSRIRDLRHTVARLKTVLKERETVEKEG